MKRNRRRRRHPILAVARAALRIGVGLAGAVLAVWTVLGVSRWVAAHPYFALAAIEIRGAESVDDRTIVDWAGLEPGASLWRVDAADAEARLRSVPRLRAAYVERLFPDRVAIAVEEREPVAVVLARGGPLFVDAEAELFRPVEGEGIEGYPYVTGLPHAAEGEPTLAEIEQLRRAVRLALLWGSRAHWPALSEIRPEESGEIVAFPEENPMAIRFSDEIDVDQFSRLASILALWRGREAQVAAVDLTMPGHAVLRLRGAIPKPKGSRGI